MIPADLPIALRPAVADDYGYILETWSKNFHKVHPWNFIPNDIYVKHQTKIINAIIREANIIVACLDDEPNQIAGYLVFEPYGLDNLIIHYGCVKGIYRRLGVMKTLLQNIGADDKTLVCSHYFDLFKKLKDKYHLVFDPTLLDRFK